MACGVVSLFRINDAGRTRELEMDDSGRNKPVNDLAGPAVTRRKRRAVRRSGVRPAAEGDVAPSLTERGIADFAVAESVAAATESKAHAIRDILGREARDGSPELADSFEAILAGASPDDIVALRNLLSQQEEAAHRIKRDRIDGELAADWREGGYPYKHLMSRRSYERRKSTSCRSSC